MSRHSGMADSNGSVEGEIDTSGVVLKEFRKNTNDGQDATDSSTTDKLNTGCSRRICIIAKLQSVFFPMKLFGLYFEDVRNACEGDFSNRRVLILGKRLYQCLVLLVLWLNCGKTLASFWVGSYRDAGSLQLLAPFLWFLQTALQASICFKTMHMTARKSSLKSLMIYWNAQPNFDELVVESYMIKYVKRTLMAAFFLMTLNLVLYAVVLFVPSESVQPLAQALVSPLPINSTAAKAVCFIVFIYCSAAWLLPFAIFSAVCLTLIHQCYRLRKTLRLTASADGLPRVKILRQQHSSLCGSVRKVDNLFKFLTFTVYATNIPLVCFLFYNLIFIKTNSVTTQITLAFWFVTVSFMMAGVSFLGAQLNSRVSVIILFFIVDCRSAQSSQMKLSRSSIRRAAERLTRLNLEERHW